jgi:hypothetical protein
VQASKLVGLGSGNVDGSASVAKFNTVRGLAVDGSGNLFVADQNNSLIRKVVLSTGQVSTLAGST